MSTEQNKATARRFVEEFFNRRNPGILDELYAPDAVEHDPSVPEPIRGREAIRQFFGAFVSAFPDLHLTIEDEIAEGDRVVQRFATTGTQNGPLVSPGGTIPPTGRPVSLASTHIVRLVDGKAVEGWGFVDMLGMLQQLGIIPAPGQAPS